MLADMVEKTVFGLAFALILGCSPPPGSPRAPAVPAHYAEAEDNGEAAELMAQKRREAEEAVRELEKAYEREDFEWVRGDAEAYK